MANSLLQAYMSHVLAFCELSNWR